MEPNVVSITLEEVPEGAGVLVTAVIKCRSCGRNQPFIFTESEHGIRYKYQAEELARTYVRRCAPLLCSPCALALPPSVGEGRTL